MLTLLVWLLSLSPEPASRVAAHAVGRPVLQRDLVAVTRRESAGVRVGVHRCDAWASERARDAAIRTGWLPPWCDGTHRRGWSTRGAHGLMAAYHLRLLGASWTCAPWLLDVPILSAIAAARKHAAVCPRDRWCPGA